MGPGVMIPPGSPEEFVLESPSPGVVEEYPRPLIAHREAVDSPRSGRRSGGVPGTGCAGLLTSAMPEVLPHTAAGCLFEPNHLVTRSADLTRLAIGPGFPGALRLPGKTGSRAAHAMEGGRQQPICGAA